MRHLVGFIGVGNMGGALAAAAGKTTSDIAVADKDEKKAADFAAEYGCEKADNSTVAKECKYIFFGVKPQFLDGMIDEIRDILKFREDRFIIVSMAAGVSIAALKEKLGFDCPVIRIMPNTPVFVSSGMILVSADNTVSREEVDEFLNIMSQSGQFDIVPESLIDAGSAISGCGPAFVYMFIQSLADGAVECGLPRDKAVRYAAETVIGSAKMALESGKHPEKLKDEVCSPGGTTIAGVHALESRGFRAACMEAVTQAYNKTINMK
ncbi:MAG: pyrroline-5-carboxylate reductase [Acutalibacteraceae bacterium]